MEYRNNGSGGTVWRGVNETKKRKSAKYKKKKLQLTFDCAA